MLAQKPNTAQQLNKKPKPRKGRSPLNRSPNPTTDVSLRHTTCCNLHAYRATRHPQTESTDTVLQLRRQTRPEPLIRRSRMDLKARTRWGLQLPPRDLRLALEVKSLISFHPRASSTAIEINRFNLLITAPFQPELHTGTENSSRNQTPTTERINKMNNTKLE